MISQIRKSKSLPLLNYRIKTTEDTTKNESLNFIDSLSKKIKDCLDFNLKKMRKKSVSCVNLRRRFDSKNNSCHNNTNQKYDKVNSEIFICTKKIDDGILPLLESAGSLSSFNSFTPATEESFLLESSDEAPNTNKSSDYENCNKRRTRGKIRCLKHRPHSLSLSERNLTTRLQENVKPDSESSKDNNSSLCKSKTNLTKCSHNTEDAHCCGQQKHKKSLKSNELIDSPTQENNNNNDTINEEAQISFSKEQRRRLKQKMRQRQKFQDKSVFLGLF
eukprot:TCONS_00015060-protein